MYQQTTSIVTLFVLFGFLLAFSAASILALLRVYQRSRRQINGMANRPPIKAFRFILVPSQQTEARRIVMEII